MKENQESVFHSKVVPGKAGSAQLFEEELPIIGGPVTCLSRTFENEEDRRAQNLPSEGCPAGFKKAWQERNYEVIINVAEKMPLKVLEEDPKLLMWYDQTVTRLGG
jgi:hypothetical protein